MSSANEQAETVKRAVSSIEICSHATTILLKGLLLPKDGSDSKAIRPSRPISELSEKDKALLATNVINTSLKTLGDAVKIHQAQVAAERNSKAAAGGKDTDTTTAAAMIPMKSRDPNQIPTSPESNKKTSKPAKPVPTECIPTIECARLAFASLRTLQAAGKITLPDLQLEVGMSSFVGRLVSLGLFEYAIREIRILKKRLGEIMTGTPHKINKAASSAQSLPEILDFGSVDPRSPVFNMVVMTQMQVLKIMSKANKPADIEAALPFLRKNHRSSPINLLLRAVELDGGLKASVARNMDTVSQLLFILVPGPSNSDDEVALDSTRSIRPLVAIELLTLGLHSRLTWWRLAGHKAEVDKDIVFPLSRYIAACIRRVEPASPALYKACHDAFNSTYEQINRQNLQPARNLRSPLSSIYQSLGKLARDLGQYSEAISWIQKSLETMDKSKDSIAICLSTKALLLAYQLRIAYEYPSLDVLFKDVLEDLQGPLRGDCAELDDFLDSMVMVRRSAMHIFVGNTVDAKGAKYQPPPSIAESLETFVLQMPRFCLRWLGNRPSEDQSKDLQRFETRRADLAEPVPQILDSVLLVLKTSLDAKNSVWEKLDPTLSDCMSLLNSLAGLACADESSQHYYKISHVYYLQYSQMIALEPKPIKNGTIFPYALKALRRSLDCIKDRSKKERDKGNFLFKLEKISQLYKAAGKPEHTLESLKLVRDTLVKDGVLTIVAQALKSAPPRKVWAMNNDVESLSWSIKVVAQKDSAWSDWTTSLGELERLAALEYGFGYTLSVATTYLTLSDPLVAKLLDVCRADRFPVRRLRILLQLLIANIGNDACLEEIQEQVQRAAWINEEMTLAEDTGLRNTVPSMKALAASIIALSRSTPDHQQLAASITVWRSILESSQDPVDLAQRIDDIPTLLEHLQSIADFARLSNRNSLMLDALQLAADLISGSATQTDTALTLQIAAALGLQLTNAGQSSKASIVFEQAIQYAQESASITDEEVVRYWLSYAEYFIEIGAVEKAEEFVYRAKTAGSGISASSRSKTHKVTMAHVSLLYAAVALGRGDAPCALTYARNATRILFQEWARLEQTIRSKENKYTAPGNNSSSKNDNNNNMAAASTTDTAMDTSQTNTEANKPKPTMSGPEAWKLAYPVIMGLLCLSNIYAHLGSYQETLYYAEQAQLVAKTSDSAAYLAECDSWLALISARANKFEDALSSAEKVEARLDWGEYSARLVSLCCRLSTIYREAKEFEREKKMICKAEDMLNRMASGWEEGSDDEGVDAMDIDPPAIAEKKEATDSHRLQASSTEASTATVAAAPISMETGTLDAHLLAIRAAVLVEKASSLVHQKNWNVALELLQEARKSARLVPSMLGELLTAARSLLGQSVEEMAKDAVCSVIQESALSFPSVGTHDSNNKRDRFSMMTATPVKAMIMSPTTARESAAVVTQSYLDNLRQARDYLLEAHALASTMGDGRQVHDILCTLQNVVILLSAASSSSPSSRSRAAILGHPGYATCSVEMARNLTWRREVKALLAEKNSGKGGMEWPEEIRPHETRRMSLSPVVDITKFQREYIDIIPPEWSVISMSLSDNKRDLCISKLQAGQSPFVIRLPLVERANTHDALGGGSAEDDGEGASLTFDQGRDKLLDFIKRANATCHDERDFSVKGAKTAWWNERTALDLELKTLMEKIEVDWLGAFKGIFSQHHHQQQQQRRGGKNELGLMDNFRASFEGILDRYLPSRTQMFRGRKGVGTNIPATANSSSASASASSKIALDTRILDLFIGLGDGEGTSNAASSEKRNSGSGGAGDFDELLNDLLYFVVDILQFNGERNAYDEIDFDSMVVETTDALRAYHEDAKALDIAGADSSSSSSSSNRNRPHTILILDKVLHTFPWESMPVLQEVPVSRVPSLACLRRLILEQQPSALDKNGDDGGSKKSGHHVSIRNGTYILNPGNDLKTTQEFFHGPLESSLCGVTATSTASSPPNSWKRVQGKPPTETEFESALATSDILLYMGHGGGSQYIRTRQIRRLEKCRATALLMGCSSGALNDVGGFEVYGLVWSYMLAGCPAVAGTLWDVTDKDIDLYTGRVYEEWGVVGKGSFKRGFEDLGGKKDGEKKPEGGKGTTTTAKRTRSVSKKKTATTITSSATTPDESMGGVDAAGSNDGTATTPTSSVYGDVSLPEAIMRAKNSGVCKFKYLNAGAVCVYGIPVYIERDE